MLFPLKIALFLREIALFHTNFLESSPNFYKRYTKLSLDSSLFDGVMLKMVGLRSYTAKNKNTHDEVLMTL